MKHGQCISHAATQEGMVLVVKVTHVEACWRTLSSLHLQSYSFFLASKRVLKNSKKL